MNAPTSNFVTRARPPGRTDTSRSLCRRLPHQFPAADEPLIPPFTREERADFNFRPLCEQKDTSERTANAFLCETQFAYFNIHESMSGNWLKKMVPHLEHEMIIESHFGPN